MTKKETKNNKEELIEDIQTATPNTAWSDDSDMPEPKTAEYKVALKLNDTFMTLFNQAIGKMPYSSIMTNNNNEKIKLIDIVRFIEVKKDNISVDEMNTVIGFIASAPFKYVRPLMEIVEDASKQKTLWDEISK